MDPRLDHVLVNQPGQALVDHEGWSAWYRNTPMFGAGLTDGDVHSAVKICVGKVVPELGWMDSKGLSLNDKHQQDSRRSDLHFDPIDQAVKVHLSLFIKLADALGKKTM